MPTINKGGDVLARGGVRATWAPGSEVSRKKWDKIFEDEEPVKKAFYIFECPVHGEFISTKKCFISGGYPRLSQYAQGKCNQGGCDEICTYVHYKEI